MQRVYFRVVRCILQVFGHIALDMPVNSDSLVGDLAAGKVLLRSLGKNTGIAGSGWEMT